MENFSNGVWLVERCAAFVKIEIYSGAWETRGTYKRHLMTRVKHARDDLFASDYTFRLRLHA
jgi:hypothetical protein